MGTPPSGFVDLFLKNKILSSSKLHFIHKKQEDLHMNTIKIVLLVGSIGSTYSALAMLNKSAEKVRTLSDTSCMELMDAISKENSKIVAEFNSSVNFSYMHASGTIHSPLSYAVARGSQVIIGILLAKGAILDTLTIREIKRINNTQISKTLRSFFGIEFDKMLLDSEEQQPIAEGSLQEIDYEAINNDLMKGDMGSLSNALKDSNFRPNTLFTSHSDSDGFGNPLAIHGTTLFIQAAAFGNIEAMRLLVEADADIYAATRNGWTALHAAATHNRVEAASYILELTKDNPAFVYRKDNLTGATAMQASVYFKKYGVRDLILRTCSISRGK